SNSMFVPNHGPRVFVEGEVDIVCSVGYRKERWPAGVNSKLMKIHHIVTDLCVMDFGGADHAVRVVSLHPGVSFEQVQAATGFPLLKAEDMGETAHPTEEQLNIIRRLDPRDTRAKQLKDNPPGIRTVS
ncbi:MAG: ketoacid CoA transferase, partial [Nevskiales bacterium]